MYRIDYSIDGVIHTHKRRYKTFRRVVREYCTIFKINNHSWIVDEENNVSYEFLKF